MSQPPDHPDAEPPAITRARWQRFALVQALQVPALALAVFAGLNMIQAAFTGFCPAAMVFKALGAKQGCAFK